MKLPDNWMLFKSLVLEKIETYCALKIWPFDFDIFTAWLSNFEDPKDEYVALHLLDCLIVRSKDMAVSGYSRLLHGELREYLIKRNLIKSNHSIESWMQSLRQAGSPIVFAPIRLGSEYGESGSTLFRLLSKYVRTDLHGTNTLSKPGVTTLILIDDFLGGGTQLETYIKKMEVKELLNRIEVIFCPLIALRSGMNRIAEIYPNLKIMPIEIIEENHELFFGSLTKKFRSDCENTGNDIKAHLSKMKNKHAADNWDYWFGKGDVNLPLVFEWGCPNQSFSILWMEYTPKNNNWRQLFSRRF